MMKIIRNFVIIFIATTVFSSLTSFAQTPNLVVEISSAGEPIPLSDIGQSMSVVNRGNAASQPFEMKLWVSVNNTFNDDDMPVTLSQPLGLEACPTRFNCPETPSLERSFKFPLPNVVDNPGDRLFGDTRSPSEWIGKTIFIQGCIFSGGVLIVCEDSERVVIAPEQPLRSVAQGASMTSIDIMWDVPPDDGGVSLVSHYNLYEVRLDSFGVGARLLTIPVSDLTVVKETGAQNRFLFTVTGVEPGVEYNYILRTCNEIGLNVVCVNNFMGGLRGFALAQFDASEGTETEAVEVTWRQFSRDTEGYDLRRCNAETPDVCETIAFNIQATDYVDRDVERGVQYIYEVFSCTSYRDPERCGRFSYFKTGVSNPGFPNLIDQYEDDDNPAQAKQVRSTVSQLRSFDTNDDLDWVEIVLSKPQAITIVTSGDTNNDTELILYQGDATTVIEGDSSGQVGLYARLKTDVLPAGLYYLKVFQKDPGLDALYKPVTNYRLDIEITERQIILAPVINLLLGD